MSETAHESLQRQIEEDVRATPVLVYAKGEKHQAMCGFSRRVMEVLDRARVPYEVRNVLANPALRPALVATTGWPTLPQVFIAGRFVGGCDIVTEMEQTGELQRLLQEARVVPEPAG